MLLNFIVIFNNYILNSSENKWKMYKVLLKYLCKFIKRGITIIMKHKITLELKNYLLKIIDSNWKYVDVNYKIS